MKLLLTSSGIRNKTIENKLLELLGKSFEESKVVFIPTASNVEPGDKSWLIKDLVKLKELNFKEIDIVDISALNQNEWLPRLENADVIFCEGGSNFYLTKWIKISGLQIKLPELLKSKVWIGASSGGMVMSKYQSVFISQQLYDEDLDKKENVNSVGLVDFHIVPHFKSNFFQKMSSEERVRDFLKGFIEKVYVLDDNSAVAVTDGKVEVVSEGEWFEIN